MSRFSLVQLSTIVSAIERPEVPVVGQTYRQVGVRLWGQGAYERESIDGGDTQYKTLNRVEVGDIIVNKIWARNGSVSVIGEDTAGCYASGEFPLFVPKQNYLVPRWFFYLTKTPDFWRQCEEKSFGTSGKNRIRPEKFLEIEIPLPPLDEQRRIVAHIDALAGQIAAARGLRHGAVEEAEAVWKSSLNTAFSVVFPQECDPQSALSQHAKKHAVLPQHKHNNASPQNPRTYSEGLFILPNGWIWSDLGSVLTHIVDCVNDTPNFASDVTDYIGLKSTNIRPYSLDLSQIWHVSAEDFRHWNRREQPKGGDIVITREAPLGNACILPDREDLCLTQRLLLLRCDEEFVSNRFILHYLNSPIFLNQVKGLSRGLTHPHLRVGDTPTILIPFSVRSEQDRIVEYLDAMQSNLISLKHLQAATAAELDALLPSLLDRAFRGEW